MAWHDWGNPPINSTYAPSAGGASTTTLVAELDSTRLGTVNLATGQKLIVEVKWILSSDTTAAFKLGQALSTGLGSTGWVEGNVFYPKVPTFNSAEFVTAHELTANHRLRCIMETSNAGANFCHISAVVQT